MSGLCLVFVSLPGTFWAYWLFPGLGQAHLLQTSQRCCHVPAVRSPPTCQNGTCTPQVSLILPVISSTSASFLLPVSCVHPCSPLFSESPSEENLLRNKTLRVGHSFHRACWDVVPGQAPGTPGKCTGAEDRGSHDHVSALRCPLIAPAPMNFQKEKIGIYSLMRRVSFGESRLWLPLIFTFIQHSCSSSSL